MLSTVLQVDLLEEPSLGKESLLDWLRSIESGTEAKRRIRNSGS